MMMKNPSSQFDVDPLKTIEDSEDSEIIDEAEENENGVFEETSTVRVHYVAYKLQLGINDFLKRNARLVTMAQKPAGF